MQVEYEEFNSLSVLGTGGDPLVIPLPNADIPLQVFTATATYNIASHAVVFRGVVLLSSPQTPAYPSSTFLSAA